jgi:iron complex outermembrane receptor protein
MPILLHNYIEALQKGDTAPDTAANANETLEPYVGTQVEVGAKPSLAG